MSQKNSKTNLLNSKTNDQKIFYCPVCGLRFVAGKRKQCPECGGSRPLALDSERAREIAGTHKRHTDKLYNLIKKQMKTCGADE